MSTAPRFAPNLGALASDGPPATYVSPALLPGDVHELLVLVDSIGNTPGLNRAQRTALAGIRSRLAGDGTPPPDLCGAICEWIRALSLGDDPRLANATSLAVVETAAQAGEFSRWEPLAEALAHLRDLLASLREGYPAPALPTPGGSCPCGWAFPVAVIPIGTTPAALETAEDMERARLKSAMVSLRCPTCGTMHGFAMPDAAKRLRITIPDEEAPS